MNKLIKMAFAAICCLAFTQCSDFLDTSSPSNIDDEFVSSSPTETLKILSRGDRKSTRLNSSHPK